MPATPFPSLAQAQNRSASPSTTTPSTSDPRLSYSRAAHTPQSPSFPEHSYFPPPGEAEHPFRYSKAQILGQWDEAKVQERPIEFMQMAEEGSVLVSKSVVRPAGLREPTELEKKVRFRTSLCRILIGLAAGYIRQSSFCKPSSAWSSAGRTK